MAIVSRDRLIDVPRGTLQETNGVDAVAVVADDAVESTFALVESALDALSPVTLRHDVAGTAGFAQKFYRLRDAGEFLVVDPVLIRRSDRLISREVELHGAGRRGSTAAASSSERLRSRAVDALAFYQSMTLRPLAEALRLLHGPERRVFGLRYLTRDLPAAICARIEALAFVRDLDDLGAKRDEATRWFDQCIARLQGHGPGSGLASD